MSLSDFFSYPIFLKSFIASLWLSVTFSLLGIFVFIKRMSFFSDGLAHALVLGLALAFLFNKNFILFGLFSGVFFSSLIYYLERKTKIHSDALIALIFVFSLSFGLILISQKSGYQPELLNFFIGNILSLSDLDFILIIFWSFFVILFFLFNFQKITLVLLDEVEARLRKINVRFYTFVFYLITGITVVLGIKIAGIILITALIILPVIISTLIARSFKETLLLAIFFGIFNTSSGFILAILHNLPVGATISFFGSLLFFLFFFVVLLKRKFNGF